MVTDFRALPRWTLLLVSLLASGCAALRERVPDGVAALIDRAAVPARVAGLGHDEIASLGLGGSCARLAEVHASGRRMPRRELEQQLPACEALVRAEQARLAEEARVTRLVEEAWQSLQARHEQLRREEEQRRLELELHRRQMQREQEKREQAARDADRSSRHQQWLEQLAGAAIHAALAGQEVQDRPLAYSPGQISERSLSNFLACVELAYPNRGYQISRDGRRLTVVARRAAMPRGEMPIEARFTEHDEFWLLTYLQVAEISAATAQDRFILAQNLVAQSCYSEDGLL